MLSPISICRLLSRSLPGIVLPLLLGACAALQPAPQPMPEHVQRVYHPQIDMSGRLSVRYQKNGNDEALHGSFQWQQKAQQTTVTLLSPLGQTMAKIDILANAAILSEPGKAPRVAGDVDSLTASALGWPLPVAGLRNWLQGFATSADGSRFTASPHSEETVTHDGWRLRYASWQESPGQLRPRRIDLERRTEQAGEVSLRIVIDAWQPS